jgi:DNA modification methylase
MTELQIDHIPIDNLIEYARNPRKNDAVVDKMCASIKEFGFRIPVIAKSDGSVVDGHLRLKAAKKLGLQLIPVILADDLSDAQIKAFRLLANQSANWADWDDDLLKLELEDLQELNFDLELTGFDFDEIQKLLDATDIDLEEPAEADSVDPADNTPVISKPGDLWILGDHRLYCGDSTLIDAYKIVLDGEQADITVCDPPYNVNYGASIKDTLRNKSRENKHKILNDNLGAGFESFLYDVCSNIIMNTKGAIYMCMAASELAVLQKVFKQAGGHWSTFLIWAKNHFSLGRADYQRQYEPILYGWREGANRHWCGARDQGDVWFIDKPSANNLHPTMKPVALMERAITNSSKVGDIVLDPFGGSGTTLMAAERTNRRCRMIELDPKYIDTIIRRFQTQTKSKAIHAATQKTFDELCT